jgi:hypothetical protein
MSCTFIDFMFCQSLSSQLHLSVLVLFLSSLLIFLSKVLSEFELSYSYVRYHVSSYLSVLGCQVQSF